MSSCSSASPFHGSHGGLLTQATFAWRWTSVCHAGWRFVDLELDVFQRRDDGSVTVEDRDEFDDAVRAGTIAPDVARLAEDTARRLQMALICGQEPWVARGWELLDAVVAGEVGAD